MPRKHKNRSKRRNRRFGRTRRTPFVNSELKPENIAMLVKMKVESEEVKKSPMLFSLDEKDMIVVKREERKEEPRTLLALKGIFKRFESRICLGGQYKTNTGVSYIAMWDIAGGSSSNVTLAWNQVGNASEFTVLDALFDEFFVRASKLRLMPSNKYSAQGPASFSVATAAGSPGSLNTCGATLVWLPHNGATYTSGATGWVSMRSAEQSKCFNTAENIALEVKNTEKFSWDGVLINSTTAFIMSWCPIGSSAQYGGTHQMMTAHSSGASISAGAFPEGAQFGDWLLEFDIAWRARA